MPLVYGKVWQKVSAPGLGQAFLGAPFLVAAAGSLLAELASRSLLSDANLDGKVSAEATAKET